MAEHLSEEEQIEVLKRWWREYGKVVVVALVLAVGLFWGWNIYQDRQVEKAQEGSILFEKFLSETSEMDDGSLTAEQQAKIAQLAEEVIAHNPDSLYADFAQMHLAKMAVDNQDYSSAIAALEEVTSEGANASIKDLARLRLARVLAADGQMEQALDVLSDTTTNGYDSAYAETRGDILMALDRQAEARTAYEAALQSVAPEQSMRRNIVQLKIDNTSIDIDAPVPAAGDPHKSTDVIEPDAGQPAGEDA